VVYCFCKELPSDAVILSSKYGQLYQCTYPPVPSQAGVKENESRANNISVNELLDPMKQLPCLFTVCGRFLPQKKFEVLMSCRCALLCSSYYLGLLKLKKSMLKVLYDNYVCLLYFND